MPTEFFGFILTDNSCWQYQKKLSGRSFLMIQADEIPDGTYVVYATTVDLDEYTDEQIWENVESYYPSMEELEKACNDKNEMDGIIAECIFEQMPWNEAEDYWEASNEAEAEKIIIRFIQDNGRRHETTAMLRAILEDEEEKRLEEVADYYYEQYTSDDQSPIKSFRMIINKYLQVDDAGKDLIDDVLINLCGWSLPTLVEQSEGYSGDGDEYEDE